MKALLRRFCRDRRGNVAIIFGMSIIPIAFLLGMGVDYGLAVDRQTQLNAFADAAALSAVTPTAMSQDQAGAIATATQTFNAQASTLSGVTYNPANLSVSVQTQGNLRTVTVAYKADSQNSFPSILGQNTMTISGSSTATAGLAPNIDFYLMLDDSPSMAIAATTTGISTMVANTKGQCDSTPYGGSTCGCAFGCHQTTQSGARYLDSKNVWHSGSLGNKNGYDNYQLAQSLGVTLRIDVLRQATQNLMTTAQQTEQQYNSSYRMAIYTFDVGLNKIGSLTSNLSTAQSNAGNIQLLQVYTQGCLTSSNCNNDKDTDFNTAMSSMNNVLPNPGSGTNNTGDSPQEVLFIVTDGLIDTSISTNPSLNPAYGSITSGRLQSAVNPLDKSGNEVLTDWCSSIKKRGIRIAILYTEYLPLTTNGWYNKYIGPIQSPINGVATNDNVGNQLQACASTGLYFEVKTGGDISAAMAALFQNAVQSAYLAK